MPALLCHSDGDFGIVYGHPSFRSASCRPISYNRLHLRRLPTDYLIYYSSSSSSAGNATSTIYTPRDTTTTQALTLLQNNTQRAQHNIFLHRIKCDCTSFSSSSAIRPSSPSSTPINVSPTSLNSRLPSTNTLTRKTVPIMTDAQLVKCMDGRLGRGASGMLRIRRSCSWAVHSTVTLASGMYHQLPIWGVCSTAAASILI